MLEKKKQVVVIGNGMVGFRFCEKLIEYDAHHRCQMTVLGDELTPAYDRISLSTLFSGRSESELIFAESRWYDYHKINLRLGARVVAIDRVEKMVSLSNGKAFPYDQLVIATGARPRVLDVPGTDLAGVHVYRTTDDVHEIRAEAREASNAIIIGGGLLGLEAAEACREMGLNTTILERETTLLERQLDYVGGLMLDRKIEDLGMHMRLDAHATALNGDQKVESVTLQRGETLPAELVIIAAGITPNDELARASGLDLGDKGGIAISETTQTSDPDIYAIGECASLNDTNFGLVAPGYAMADAAAAQLSGVNKNFEMLVPAAKLKLLDLQVASIGETHLEAPDARCVVDQDPKMGVYKKLIMSKDLKKLLGAILIGESSEFERLRTHIEQGQELVSDPKSLLAPIGEPMEIEIDMEDDDVVCFCNFVTKGDIKKAIDDHKLSTADEVRAKTYASSVCGSCYELVNQVTKQYIETGV